MAALDHTQWGKLVGYLKTALVAGCLACALTSTAWAAGGRDADPALLSFGGGYSDVIAKEKPSADFRLEYRSNISLLPFLEPYAKFKPWVGVEATARGSFWGGGGFLFDVPLGDHFALSPSIGVGGYTPGTGAGKNLGSAIEFRSQMEVAYKFDDGSRLAAAFSHTSNAGISSRNPGTEVVELYYQVPISEIGSLFGN